MSFIATSFLTVYLMFPAAVAIISQMHRGQQGRNRTTRKKNILMGFPHLLLLSVIFFISGTVTGAASPVEISVNTTSQSVEKGTEFSINISIDPVNNPISAAQFNLFFDGSLVNVKNVTEGDLFKKQGINTIFDPGTFSNSDGTLINVWGLIITPGANVTTKGTLATISLYAKNTGTSQLNLTNVIISDPNGTSVQVNRANSSIKVSYETIPPASIKNLRNASYAQYYINWTWTDPVDADLSKVMIYLDGRLRTNVSKGLKYYNATGLVPGTMHTISTKTVDIAGNTNKTWVNHSARTVPDPIPPASIRNLRNASYAQYYINWTWTDPVDTDLSKVMVYLNGRLKSNVSKGVKYYNTTGLIPGTTYTVSTKTVDIAGNTNSTWVNYSAKTMPDLIPPASIKYLKNTSYARYYINWTWTDPIDTDLSKVMMYLDGKFRTNVSRGIRYYNATGLITGTMYTLSTRTVDIAGNTNKTWINHSARTMP
ncbi:MAG: cohesin domain-containing protein [Candidatus Methanoperedens sp.]|nr:cohesin domain-containing protein [Candidatus Methanoperedens sp.]